MSCILINWKPNQFICKNTSFTVKRKTSSKTPIPKMNTFLVQLKIIYTRITFPHPEQNWVTRNFKKIYFCDWFAIKFLCAKKWNIISIGSLPVAWLLKGGLICCQGNYLAQKLCFWTGIIFIRVYESVSLSVSLYIHYLKKFLTDFDGTWQDDVEW